MKEDNSLNSFGMTDNNLGLELSYSRISDFDRNGPVALIKRTYTSNEGTKTGSLTDDLLFDKDNIKNKYHVSDIIEPTASLSKLVNIILENYTYIPSLEEVDEIVINNELWKSTKVLETRRKNYDIPNFWEYLDLKFNHNDKLIITSDRKLLAEELVSILRTHNHCKHYFESEELLTQVEFKVEYKDIILKGLIDMIIIDHTNKTIKGVDLKTGSSNAMDFQNSYFKWRYYLQEAVYSIAIKHLIDNIYTKLKDYQILNFEFLYIGTKEKLPIIYVVDEFWHIAALYGFTSNGVYYNGLNELIDEIKFHWNNKLFDLPKKVYDNNGVLTFKSEGVDVNKTHKI